MARGGAPEPGASCVELQPKASSRGGARQRNVKRRATMEAALERDPQRVWFSMAGVESGVDSPSDAGALRGGALLERGGRGADSYAGKDLSPELSELRVSGVLRLSRSLGTTRE